MKKLNYLLLGLGAFALASCSQEDVTAPGSGDGNVAITVSLPADLATRADFGSGTSSKVLQYAVYKQNTGESYTLADSGTADFGTGLTTTLNLNLIPTSTYTMAFFAQSEESINENEGEAGVYTFEAGQTGATMTVNYKAMTSADNNADAYDCFYNILTDFPGSQTSGSVTLNRPVAQVNWGANDIDATSELTSIFGENGQYIMTEVSAKLNTTLNLLSGVTGTPEEVTIGTFAIPQGQTYPISGYQYVALQYILASNESSIYQLTMNISNSGEGNTASAYTNTVQVENVPLQANYRTNIYGALLSSTTSIQITVDPIFGNSNNVPLKWDGTTVTKPVIIGNTVNINQPSDLAGLAAMINGGEINGEAQTATDFAGKTIVLGADMDLAGEDFPMIGSAVRNSGTLSSSNSFRGTFDGKGHTISNISVKYDGNEKNTAVGIFANIDGTGTVKDVIFEDINIEGGASEQAGVVGIITNGGTVSGVTVKSGSVSATEGAGGIAGRILKNGTITGCSNSASISVNQENTNENSQNAGGIVGAATYTEDGTSMVISNCTNYGNVTATGGKLIQSIGGIVGTCAATVSGCVNNGDVTADGQYIGGIVGTQYSAGSIEGCTNNGTVKGKSAVAGILGFLSYTGIDQAVPSYPRWNVITVTKNVSNGDLEATGGYAGGILGLTQNKGVLTNNNVTAGTIKASGVAAGVVGSCSASSGQMGYQGGLTVSDNYVSANTSLSGNTNVDYVNGTGWTGTGNNNTTPNNP